MVEQLVAAGLTGLAPLSGIPGSSGATPVQNVGAYGTEIAEMLTAVAPLYDRTTGELRRHPAADLQLGYRSSSLRGTDRAVGHRDHTPTRPGAHDDQIRRAGPGAGRGGRAERAGGGAAAGGAGAPTNQRDADRSRPRRAPDTRSAGSFFTNPILDEAQATRADRAIRARLGGKAGYPHYPAGEGHTKLSAAWLIQRAGCGKGYDGPGGRVGLSTKHTLALVNRGGSTADLLELAREIGTGCGRRSRSGSIPSRCWSA